MKHEPNCLIYVCTCKPKTFFEELDEIDEIFDNVYDTLENKVEEEDV